MSTNLVQNGELVSVIDWAEGVYLESAEYPAFDGTPVVTLRITGFTAEDFVKHGLMIEREPTAIELLDHQHKKERAALVAALSKGGGRGAHRRT